MRVRDSDLKRIELIKAFYREHCQLDPSNSILIRVMLEDSSRCIESTLTRLKAGTPEDEILSYERARLMAAVPNE